MLTISAFAGPTDAAETAVSAPRDWRYRCRPLVLVVAVEAICVGIVRAVGHARPAGLDALGMFPLLWLATFIVFVGMAAFALVRTRPDGSPVLESYRIAFRTLRERWWTNEWMLSVVVVSLLGPIGSLAVSAAQPAIALAHPFAWDVPLDALERFLHVGKPLWVWLQPLTGRPAVTIALDWLYFPGWPNVLVVAGTIPIIAPESRLRWRFLLASGLVWFVGGILTELLFSSGGPCYFGRIVSGPDPYAPLMAYLGTVNHAHPLVSRAIQDGMWRSYEQRQDVLGIGVAAMPSLHVASMTVVTCGAFAVRRWLGLAMLAFTCVIFIGSVSLGWHYAIDGYAGALMAVGCWWAAGRMIR